MDRTTGGKKRRGRRFEAGKACHSGRMLCALFLVLGGILFAGQPQCYGKEKQQGQESPQDKACYTNPDTGYRVLVEDGVGLLAEEERQELAQVMRGITAYGNVAFVTVENNDFSTEGLARDYYRNRFGTDSGTVFVIDMDQRNIWIHSDGAVYQVITSSYADTVTDNVYRYASRGDYYGCAEEAFREMYALLEGQRIAQPMKYISNALLAMILALLANFGLVIGLSRQRGPGEKALLAGIDRRFRYSEVHAVHTHQSKIYDPVSSGSSGGSGGGGGGGGGGHSF